MDDRPRFSRCHSLSRAARAALGGRYVVAVLVLGVAAALALASQPGARAQDDDCTPSYQPAITAWMSFLTDPTASQPALPSPQDPCDAVTSQALQDALSAWNTSRLLALTPVPAPPTPSAVVATRTPTAAPAAPTATAAPQGATPPTSCTQPQFIVAPTSVREGDTAVIVITGFAPGSSGTLTVTGLVSGRSITLPFVASADCSVAIGGDAASHLPADTYQLHASGMGYPNRPLELSAGLTVR